VRPTFASSRPQSERRSTDTRALSACQDSAERNQINRPHHENALRHTARNAARDESNEPADRHDEPEGPLEPTLIRSENCNFLRSPRRVIPSLWRRWQIPTEIIGNEIPRIGFGQIALESPEEPRIDGRVFCFSDDGRLRPTGQTLPSPHTVTVAPNVHVSVVFRPAKRERAKAQQEPGKWW